MAEYRSELAKYFGDALGVSIKPTSWPGKNRLPIYLRQAYDFDQFDLLDRPCITMVDTSADDVSPATIRKHVDQLREKFAGDVIYVRQQLASYLRKRLIEQRVQFVVPGNQMYLPSFGIDLREFFRQQRPAVKQLSPAAQLTFLSLLVNRNITDRTVNGLAQLLGYSKMSISRVLSELENAELGRVEIRGRHHSLSLMEDRKQAWERAQSRLKSPVSKRLAVDAANADKLRVRAGLSALAEFSSISAGARRTYATTAKDFAEYKDKSKTKDAMVGEAEVEIWTYDPKLLMEHGIVDRFSLFLSMRDSEDERVQAALGEMMETIEW